MPEAVEAVKQADLIVVGPGSLYTSILPNLLVPGIREGLIHSAAKIVYICNVMTQPGETDGYTAEDHVQAIYDHVGHSLFDVVVVNRGEIPQGCVKTVCTGRCLPCPVSVGQLG